MRGGNTGTHAASPLRDPAGITLEILEGPHDGMTCAGRGKAITVGRGPGNSIELPHDSMISHDHCVIRYSGSQGSWVLEDRGSTNGTWFAGGKISSPVTLEAGSILVVGASVLRCEEGCPAENFLPDETEIRRECERLQQLFDTSAARGWGAAVMSALAEGTLSMTDRHLFLGTVSANATLPVVADGQGVISRRLINQRIKPGLYWTGKDAWVSKHVKTASIAAPSLESDLFLTPRIYRILMLAQSHAGRMGREALSASDLLHGLVSDPSGRVRTWLRMENIDINRVLAELERAGTGTLTASAAGKISPGTPVEAVPPVQRPPVLDPGIFELASTALGTLVRYQLASAEERQKAVRETLLSRISTLPAPRRVEFLQGLQQCFPLIRSASVESGETIKLKKKIRLLEAQQAARQPRSEIQKVFRAWQDALSPTTEPRLDLLLPEDAAAVALIRQLVTFSLAVERFVVGIVAGLNQQGTSSSQIGLPGFRASLTHTVKGVLEGRPSGEAFQNYLNALESWLVAMIAAYHSAPEEWFKEFWKKVSPVRIEAKVPAKFLSDAKCWAQYKTLVRRVSPDLVADEIHALVRQEAHRQFHELNASRR